jgi:AcrR family transcriptional regulator
MIPNLSDSPADPEDTESIRPRGETARLRREQIVEAAIAIIGQKGLQNLSLAEIEKHAHMSRGQLTYYFKQKEDILIAVFDRMLELMCQRIEAILAREGKPICERSVIENCESMFRGILTQPPLDPNFHALLYTFLSQINHREDYRHRIASFFGNWRIEMSHNIVQQGGSKRASPIATASIIQALAHGLSMQLEADPKAFDRHEMVDLCIKILKFLLTDQPSQESKT